MKTSLWSAILAGVTLVASAANATQINIASGDFRAITGSEQHSVSVWDTGINNFSASMVHVGATIPHNPSLTGFTVYVDGSHTGSQVTSCTLSIYNYNSALLASVTRSTGTVTGIWELNIPVTAAQSPLWSYFNIDCGLAPNSASLILGATVV